MWSNNMLASCLYCAFSLSLLIFVSSQSNLCSDFYSGTDGLSCLHHAHECSAEWMATPNCDFTCGRCSACTDLYPFNDAHTCELQASWGKCNENFMKEFPHICDYSCGRCSTKGPVLAKSKEVKIVKGYSYDDQSAPPAIDCSDIYPFQDGHSCAEQVKWGKCKESFMANACNYSCGRCSRMLKDSDHDIDDKEVQEDQPVCTDIYPFQDGHSCAEQVKWGKCKESFMANACNFSCGRCSRNPKRSNHAAQPEGQSIRSKSCSVEVKSSQLSFDVDVGNCRSNNVGSIQLELSATPLNASVHIQFTNAAAAELILLSFTSANPVKIFAMTLASASQGDLKIFNGMNSTMLTVEQLFLENLALVSKPNLIVQYCYLNSSQDIVTSLPTTTVEAVIAVLPSPEMVEVQSLLTAVNIIPGAGQLAYAEDYVQECWVGADCSGIPGVVASIDLLSQAVPQLKWAAPVIVWYGDSLDFETMRILPGEENAPSEYYTTPWPHYHVISKDEHKNPNYGSTVHDCKYLRYIQLLKRKGYKVMVYPMLLLDLRGKPWRGHVTLRQSASESEISRVFFRRRGYAEFILHYARLVRGQVDAFVIGSEFKQLTKSSGFVRCLIQLAAQVKAILGAGVTVTYAADWSEYHHHGDGQRTLDALWASPHIDVVGIDAYFPLQDRSAGDDTTSDIFHGWESGELWDYYIDSSGIKKPLEPEWAIKNLERWWNSSHGRDSSWVPRMKPVWFTEFGFPSIHRSANQPNVFWNPNCSDGAIPHHSSGNVDFSAQTKGVLATLQYWQNRSEIVQNLFLYAWDARPYPHFPGRMDLWSDGNQWSRGHWINGKLQPEYSVTLRGAVQAAHLTVYANYLDLGPEAEGIDVEEVIAATVRVVGDITGKTFAVHCSDFIVQKPVVIKLAGAMKVECDACAVAFPSHKVTERLFSRFDEYIQASQINVGSLFVTSKSLTLYSATVVVTGAFEVRTSGDFQLISEVEQHSRWWYSEGRRAYGFCGPRKKSGGSERNDVLRQTEILTEDFTFEVKGRFHSRAALITTTTVSGYSVNFLFEPVSLERYHHSWSKKTNLFRTRKSDSRRGGTRYDGAVLLVADTAYIFSEIDITIIAGTVMGDDVTMEAKTISFLTAVGNQYEHFRLTKKGILKFSTNSGNGEFSVSAGSYYHSQQRDNVQDVPFPTTVHANKLTIRAHDLIVKGANIIGENATIVADKITHESVLLCGFQKYSETNIEAGIKIGFQERISTFLDSVKDLLQDRAGGSSQNAPAVVKAVNFVSKAKSVLRQAAAYSRAVTGGVWLYGDASRSTQEQYQEWGLNNLIQATALNVTAKEWSMENLQISGRDVFLAVDTIVGKFARSRLRTRVSQDAVHGEFNLYGNTDSRVEGEHSGVRTEDTSYTTNTIEASGTLHITARNITGAFDMSAAEVQILTETLQLISKQDESSMSAGAQSLSASLSGSFGGHTSQAKQNSKITNAGRSRIVARDVLLINATGAIHLTGAYLDCASGNLTVLAAEIKAYTLHDYVVGSSAGAGGSVDLTGDFNNPRISVGDTDLHREVRGAIGAGIVIVGGKEIKQVLGSLGGLSRDTSMKGLDGHRWEMNADLGAVNLDPLFGDANDKRDFATRLADAVADSLNEAVSGMVEGVVRLAELVDEAFSAAADTDDLNAYSGAPSSSTTTTTPEAQRKANADNEKKRQQRVATVTSAVAAAKDSFLNEEGLSEKEVTQILHDTLGVAQHNIQESHNTATALLPFGAPACAQSHTCMAKMRTLYDNVMREASDYYRTAEAFALKHSTAIETAVTVAELVLFKFPVKTAFTSWRTAKAALNVRTVVAPMKTVATATKAPGTVVVRRSSLPQESPIQYLNKPGRVSFKGVEFRGVRELRHLSDQQLRHMAKRGTNPMDSGGRKLVGHHHQQKGHRDPGAFIVELPASAHSVGKKVQHPLGNKGGISKEARADWNKVRTEFNKQRARDELRLRNSAKPAAK